MKLFRHNKSWKIAPMLIIGNYDEVIDHIWSTSEVAKNYEKDFFSTDVETCMLDPGGMYNTKIPHKQFIIDEINFDIQISRVEDVLLCMSQGKERIPGYIRFPNWRFNIILPIDIFERLKKELITLEKTDEALHAEIQDRTTKDEIHEKGHFIR